MGPDGPNASGSRCPAAFLIPFDVSLVSVDEVQNARLLGAGTKGPRSRRCLSQRHSLEGLSLSTDSRVDQVTVNRLDLRDLLHNHWPVLLLRACAVNWIVEEEDRPQIGKLSALRNFFPALDLVVRNVESVELLKRRQVVESLDLVVGEPELLECGSYIFEVLDSLDVVAGEGENFETLEALHGHDLNDGVCRERQPLTVLKLIDLVVKLLNGVGQLADEGHFGGLLRRDAVLGFPPTDGFTERNAGHFRL